MSRRWRWPVVISGTVALAALPLVIAAVPVPGRSPDAATLLTRIRSAADAPYQGWAESTGSLVLPVTDNVEDVSSLLGGRTQMRVWWGGDGVWRVDSITPVGEQSVRTAGAGAWLWDYEDNRATITALEPSGAVRMPRSADALPPALAERLLSEATPAQVTHLSPRRVAGRAADGLSLHPSDPDSSISRVDVWADRESSVPVTVEVYSAASGTPAMSTTFLDFAPVRPTAAELSFSPPPGVRVRTGDRPDLVGLVNRFSQGEPPARLLGYDRQASPVGGAVGLYGRGVTQVAVAPVSSRRAAAVRRQLQVATGVTELPEGLVTSVGPVGLLLTDPGSSGGQSWLVTGTMTRDGLARAARALASAGSAP